MSADVNSHCRDGGIGRRIGLKIRSAERRVGVRFPLPAPATLVSTGYDRLPSTSLVFRDTFQGRKGFAHEQARVRVEVCPCSQEVALLQSVRRQERENKA